MTALSKTKRPRRLHRYAVALLLTTLPMLNSCAATRWGGGSGIVIDAATKEPIAGAHVVLYISTSAPSAFPFGNSTQGCGPDFYAVSDAEGKFTIPEDALDQPWRFSLTRIEKIFHAIAYKRGYIDARQIEGIRQTGEGDVKTGPLRMTFGMMKDTRTLWDRAQWLAERTGAGCQCNEMHRAMAAELKEISLPAVREEAARLKLPFIQTGAPLPRKTCE